MVRLSDDVDPKSGTSAGQAAVHEAAFHAAELDPEPLVEQHFGGLSDHLAEDSVEGFLARASHCVREYPWTATGTALALGMLLGMLTAPTVAKPIRAIKRRRSARRNPGRDSGRNTLEDAPGSIEDAAYRNRGVVPDAVAAADNLSGL